jgi:O-antigen/teichoic acid export membrane protein
VVFLAWRWEGRVAGILIAYVLVGLYGFYYFLKRGILFGSVRKKYIYSELLYAIPIIVMQTSIFCMSASDRFFLSHYIDDKNETVGIYTVVVTFGSIIIILSTALLQYIFPKIYSQLSSPRINYSSIRRSFLMYAAVMTAGMIIIVLLTPVAYHFFINERYHSALRYIFLTTGGYFLWTIAYFFYSFLLYFKEKKKIFILSVCCIVVSLSFNYFCIQRWGMWGAAVSHVAAYFIVLVLTLAFTRSYWKHFLGPKR